jgi:hypothetical protein
MAKPIEGIPVFTGKAAAWLTAYLEKAKPSAQKAEEAERDRQATKDVKPLKR